MNVGTKKSFDSEKNNKVDTVFDVAILGAGASGSFLAANLSSKLRVALVDLNSKIAKKILATGNGRCNLSNLNMSSDFFNQNIDCFLKRFDQKQTIKTFEDFGLQTFADEGGRIYPLSNSAKSVVDVLTNEIEKKNFDVFLQEQFLDVKKFDDFFEVLTSKQKIVCKNLVVALGGNSCKNIAKSFGVEYKNCLPSLCALKTQSTKKLENCKIHNALIVAQCNNQISTEQGEVLFKDSGISGICAFNLSAFFARMGKFDGKLIVDLLPNFKKNQVQNLLEGRRSLALPAHKFFDGIFVRAVGEEILLRAKIDFNKNSSTLCTEEIEKIAQQTKAMQFDVKGCFENNQVFCGGVALDALDKNLQSLAQKNLFFVGEAVDVDGICGGYNLQWAWTSAKLVANCLQAKQNFATIK